MKHSELRIKGKRGCIVCINISDYGDSLVASAEEDNVTEFQMLKALRKEYPHFSFQPSAGRGDGIFIEGQLKGGIRTVITN